MKMYVNENCIGCGLCTNICPEVFHINDEGLAEATLDEIQASCTDKAKEALNECPVEAIEEK